MEREKTKRCTWGNKHKESQRDAHKEIHEDMRKKITQRSAIVLNVSALTSRVWWLCCQALWAAGGGIVGCRVLSAAGRSTRPAVLENLVVPLSVLSVAGGVAHCDLQQVSCLEGLVVVLLLASGGVLNSTVFLQQV